MEQKVHKRQIRKILADMVKHKRQVQLRTVEDVFCVGCCVGKLRVDRPV